jgi:hypothetical protein
MRRRDEMSEMNERGKKRGRFGRGGDKWRKREGMDIEEGTRKLKEGREICWRSRDEERDGKRTD